MSARKYRRLTPLPIFRFRLCADTINRRQPWLFTQLFSLSIMIARWRASFMLAFPVPEVINRTKADLDSEDSDKCNAYM